MPYTFPILVTTVSILALYLVAIEIRLFMLCQKMRFLEEQIITLYRRKIDKIPALIEVMRHLESHEEATNELKLLHRKAITASSDRIYDILEMNALLTERFAFLMRLSLVVRSLQRDGNFIHTRETITVLEESISRLIQRHVAFSGKYNSLVRAKNWTIIGFVLPGSKKMAL